MINQSWGTKRTCPSCSSHFYDLNKQPAVCPKCRHQFDPTAIVRAKRKPARREVGDGKKDVPAQSVLAQKKAAPRRKEEKNPEDQVAGEGGIGDIAEMEDVDDIENLRDLSELEEREEPTVSGDDTDDEAIIEELDAGDKTIVGSVEEEEANVLVEELDEDEDESASKKKLKKKHK